MAYPVINSPMFPSTADAPFLPPKLKDMPIFNPGTRYYQCEDGVVRLLTENQAINLGISCRAIEPSVAPMVLAGPRYRTINLGAIPRS